MITKFVFQKKTEFHYSIYKSPPYPHSCFISVSSTWISNKQVSSWHLCTE